MTMDFLKMHTTVSKPCASLAIYFDYSKFYCNRDPSDQETQDDLYSSSLFVSKARMLPSLLRKYRESPLLSSLRSDCSVLTFDTNKKEGILIDDLEFLDLSYGKISTSQNIWLGRAEDLRTLVCIFRKYIVIDAYMTVQAAIGGFPTLWTASV